MVWFTGLLLKYGWKEIDKVWGVGYDGYMCRAEGCFLKREYAEAYVKWADSDGFNLDFTSLDGIICGGFTAIFLIAAVSSHRFVFSTMLVVLLLGYCVLIAILKQKLQTLTYFQKFLNIGASGVFTRVMFLLMALTILEVTAMYGICYYLTLVAVWLLVNLLDFGFTWWRIQNGRYYVLQEQVKEGKKQKGRHDQKRRSGALALACVVGGLGGLLGRRFAKVFFANVSQAFAVNFAVWLFLAIGLLLGMGSSELWKAYYVKKYDIQGKSIPAYMPRPGQKQTMLHSILRTLGTLGRILLIMIAFSVGITLVMCFFMRWLPEWQGRM